MKNRKYYVIDGIINSHMVKPKRKFYTRDAAINYMCRLLPNNYHLEDEYAREKHVIEYKFNDVTRFIISRVLA